MGLPFGRTVLMAFFIPALYLGASAALSLLVSGCSKEEESPSSPENTQPAQPSIKNMKPVITGSSKGKISLDTQCDCFIPQDEMTKWMVEKCEVLRRHVGTTKEECGTYPLEKRLDLFKERTGFFIPEGFTEMELLEKYEYHFNKALEKAQKGVKYGDELLKMFSYGKILNYDVETMAYHESIADKAYFKSDEAMKEIKKLGAWMVGGKE